MFLCTFLLLWVFLYVDERCFMLVLIFNALTSYTFPSCTSLETQCLCQKNKEEDNGRVEFNRGFYLASCCESINSKTTILIDIIDSNNVLLRILWLYRFCSLFILSQFDSAAEAASFVFDAWINEEVSNKLDLRFTFSSFPLEKDSLSLWLIVF